MAFVTVEGRQILINCISGHGKLKQFFKLLGETFYSMCISMSIYLNFQVNHLTLSLSVF